jgi:hypothetical protein
LLRYFQFAGRRLTDIFEKNTQKGKPSVNCQSLSG